MMTNSEQLLSADELAELRQYAGKQIRLWRQRALFSTLVLLLSCASVYPFLAGHALQGHWGSFGKYLVLLSMGLLLVCVLCNAFWYNSWQALRDAEKGPAVNAASDAAPQKGWRQ
jgi:hypothetical protein